ncbi:MAG: hypothetical protein IKK60_08475 [Clostridia bacterium]|nr:hypothetical protein [Clostridia bacterium]
MGVWGMGITQSDEYCEVYEKFMERYNEGDEASEITASILDEYHKVFDDNDGILHDVYFALAKAEWMCCEQSERVLLKVQQIIENGENIKFYRELEATEADLKLREKNLKSFFVSLKTPRKIAKKRTPVPKYDYAILEKGSLFWYQSKSTIYGALVLEKIENGYHTEYLIVLTQKLSKKPKISKEILEAEVYTFAWFSELLPTNRVHIIDQIEITGNYNGRAGIYVSDNISYCENTGTDSTWSHNSSNIIFSSNKNVKDLLIVENVPSDFKHQEYLKQLIEH